MRYISRDYGDASFIYEPRSGSSVFLDGSLASPALLLLTDANAALPFNYLQQVGPSDRPGILADWADVRRSISDFVQNAASARPTGDSGDRSALEELSLYAVKRWQVVNVAIELTSRCNLRCRGCYQDSFKLAGLSRARLQKIGDELAGAGAIFALFTGGETLLRGDAIDVMTDFADRGFVLELKTNGTLLRDDFVRRLAELPILDVQVSVYDLDDGWSDWARANYDLKRIEGGVARMLELAVPVTLSVLVGRHNVMNLKRIHQRLTATGAKVFYSPYITPNRGGAAEEISFRLSASELELHLRPFLQSINAMPALKQYRNCANDCSVCYAGRDQIAIAADGRVYPCLDLRIPLGNLSAEDLAPILARRRDKLAAFTLLEMPACMSCTLRDFCDSCIGISLIENGDYRTPSPHKCDVTHFYGRGREKSCNRSS